MTGRRHVGAMLVIGALGAAALAIAAPGVDVVAARVLSPTTHASRPTDDRFQHARHARLFPLCATCHAGVTQPGQPIMPNPSGCASCHDGVIERRVTWQPRTVTLPTRNLRTDGGLRQLCYLSRAEFMHYLPSQCARISRDSRARDG